MPRRIDTYLRDLVRDDKFSFYETVRDFGDAEIAPHPVQWECARQRLCPTSAARHG
jgi:hypothetical protein